MKRLLYFYPENDLALADNTPNYTAPHAAVELRQSGEQLPLWFGDDGDMVFTTGTNAMWYDAVAQSFNLKTKLWNRDRNLVPTPWGWSLSVRRFFERNGFNDNMMPTNDQIAWMRALSHRRVSAKLSEMLRKCLGNSICEPAVELSEITDIHDFISQNGRSIVKLPWSGSGRGLIDSDLVPDPEFSRRTQGSINRQGSVMVEKYYPKHYDFALLYNMRESKAEFVGYSLFETDARGVYTGNLVASDDKLLEVLSQHVDRQLIVNVAEQCSVILSELIGDNYEGPLGVDMMTVDDGTLAVAEINLRNTMGHVAHCLSQRYVGKDTQARFVVQPNDNSPVNMPENAIIRDHRLLKGTIDLTPGDRRFRFLLTTQNT